MRVKKKTNIAYEKREKQEVVFPMKRGWAWKIKGIKKKKLTTLQPVCIKISILSERKVARLLPLQPVFYFPFFFSCHFPIFCTQFFIIIIFSCLFFFFTQFFIIIIFFFFYLIYFLPLCRSCINCLTRLSLYETFAIPRTLREYTFFFSPVRSRVK